MKTDRKNLRNLLAAGLAVAGMTGMAAQAYGPLYVWDYASGTPYRWDVSSPVPVWTDGGNFASGTVSIWVDTPETCNAESDWQCGHYEDLYVEYTNEQGVTRVAEALASWSAVPTSSFQAEVAGSLSELGLGGADGDITGAAEEFGVDGDGNIVHEILGTDNGGGIHVVFDEDGSVMANVLGVPNGVLGVASPEFADEATGIITEGWVFIGGGQTWYNDEELAQMAGVITHELGHSFNLAHSQTNGHIVMYGQQTVATAGPVDCSAHWYVGGDYELPFPQNPGATAADMEVMYPYINNNPDAWPSPTGQYQATVSTREDHAAISSLYPAASFATQTGTLTGTVTYPFSMEGIIGINVVARNIDNPWEDAITVMTGDWNDGIPDAEQGVGEFSLHGLTPGARYVVHVENILAGGFPTPQVALPGPTEYFNGSRENDDATSDDACDYQEIQLAAGQTLGGVDIRINGVKKAPQLVIIPAPNGAELTENGRVAGATISDFYGEALSWLHQEGSDSFTVLPMGGIRMSDNGQVIGGRVIMDDTYLPARLVPGKRIELLPLPDNAPCDQGGGLIEYYSNHAISPDGSTLGGFLWNCDAPGETGYFRTSAVTWSEATGWTVLNSHLDGLSSRVNAIANDRTAIGWSALDWGWWEGRVWKNGEEISMKDMAPANIQEIGEATAITTDGRTVVGIEALDEFFNPRSYRYDTVSGAFEIIDVAEPCPPFDWFCFGDTPFNAYDIADNGMLVGAIGYGTSAKATVVDELLGTLKLVDFLKGQGVMNASDLDLGSAANKITTNGRHIAGWAAVGGMVSAWKLTFDQLWVCRNGKSRQVGMHAIADQFARGATLGLCEADLPLQYKGNY